MFINDEITYDTVMKSSSVGVGVHGLQAQPQKFWFAEKLGKNGARRCLTSKSGARFA